MKVEIWNGHNIRFVEYKDEWWAVLSDIASALSLNTKKLNQRLEDDVLSKYPIKDSLGRIQKTSIVSEFGIYDAIFSSRKPEAKEFKRWVFNIIKSLRESAGIEGFQVFRMLDKEHQIKMMSNLNQSLEKPVRRDFIKANTIANKAVSTMNGYPKMVKKDEMSPEMLAQREPILEDTVELMKTRDKFGLDFSISKAVYKKVLN